MLSILNFFGLTTLRDADETFRIAHDEMQIACAHANEIADAAEAVLAKPIATGESRKALRQAVDDFRAHYHWDGDF